MTERNTSGENSVTIEQTDMNPLETIIVISEISTLESYSPHEATGDVDIWVVRDKDTYIGIAVVEPPSGSNPASDDETAWIHRIGIIDAYQGEGHGRQLLENLFEYYGAVELEIRGQKPANEFYENMGMRKTEERWGAFDDGEGTLNTWRRD